MQPPECQVRSQSALRRSSWCWCVWSCQCFSVSAPGWLNRGALCRCCTGWRWATAPRSPYQYLQERETLRQNKSGPSKPTNSTCTITLYQKSFRPFYDCDYLGDIFYYIYLRKSWNAFHVEVLVRSYVLWLITVQQISPCNIYSVCEEMPPSQLGFRPLQAAWL